MRRVCRALVALALASLPARADVLVLTDGTEVLGRVSLEGESVVVHQRFGETRYSRDDVKSIATDEELKREDERAEAAWRAERERRRAPADPVLPPEKALVWEKDAATAARLAAEQHKLVLTFVVVGDLGTGRC